MVRYVSRDSKEQDVKATNTISSKDKDEGLPQTYNCKLAEYLTTK